MVKLPKLSKLFVRMGQKDALSLVIGENATAENFKRNMIIPISLDLLNVPVHNGRVMELIAIRSNMLGHKLGEFSLTKLIGSEVMARRKARLRKKKKKK